MSQTSTNITPKYHQETHYNYVRSSVFFASNCSPLLCYRSVTTALTAQIPMETLSQSHRLCFMLLCYNHAKTTTFSAQSFTGKERDSETGFSYFGARYYDSDILTGWLSVDPLADKYPSLFPYAYCGWNPVKLVDPDGRDTLNFANSRFLRTQPDYSNAIIINAHGSAHPPKIENDNIDFDHIFPIISSNNDINTKELEAYILQSDSYQTNCNNNNVTPLFLISCKTGECSIPFISFADGLSRAIPNALIVAPVGDVHAKKGIFYLAPTSGENYSCFWRVIYNGQDIGRIENQGAFNLSTLVWSTQKIVNTYNSIHSENPIILPNIEIQ